LTEKKKKKIPEVKDWQKLQKRLKKKIKAKTDQSNIKLRKDLTEEEKATNAPKIGRPITTTDGLVNSLEKQSREKPPSLTEPFLGPDPSETPSHINPDTIVLPPKSAGKTLIHNDPCQDQSELSCPPPPSYLKTKPVHQNSAGQPTNLQTTNKTQSSQSCPSLNNTSCPSPPRLSGEVTLRAEPTDEGYALYSPERNSFDLLKLIQAGHLDAGELTIDERVIIVRSLKLMGRTQDEIAAMMRVNRRMVERDYKRIREMDKHTLMSYELEELGGEIHALCMHAAQAALKDKKFFSVPKILESMTNMLQSMGLVYKAPAKSQVAAMVGIAHSQVGQRAYHKYQDSIGNERDKVLEVLGQMLAGVQDGKV
jgi:hypothetical protein